MKMNILDWITFIIVIIGGLNWGLVGVADFDLVAEIFGADSTVAMIIYILVGVSALYMLVMMAMKSKGGMEMKKEEMPPQQGSQMS
ncbi:MAG: DUF378 domain-containing protein [Parcubacteria group bacterium]